MTVKLKAISVVWGRSLRAVAGMAIILAAIGCALSSPASAQVQDQFQILHSFGSAGDGSGPVGLLVFDQEGNLYGVALGGVDNGGIVYELMPEGNGEWTEAILHNFPYNDPNDGSSGTSARWRTVPTGTAPSRRR